MWISRSGTSRFRNPGPGGNPISGATEEPMIRPDEASDAELLEQFITAHDEAAFEAIITRHGPMVLAVCRRLLRNVHDADDVFQATFLLLSQKARSVRKHDSLAGWLHGVATRIAIR